MFKNLAITLYKLVISLMKNYHEFIVKFFYYFNGKLLV